MLDHLNHVVNALVPAANAFAGTVTTKVINLKNYGSACFIIQGGAGAVGTATEWDGAAWQFYTPATGWSLFIDDELKLYGWSGSAWVRTGGALQTVTAGAGLTGGGQADTVTMNIGAGLGITVNADDIAAKPYKGVTVDANGIAANIDADSIQYDAANGNRLMVGNIDGGTF